MNIASESFQDMYALYNKQKASANCKLWAPHLHTALLPLPCLFILGKVILPSPNKLFLEWTVTLQVNSLDNSDLGMPEDLERPQASRHAEGVGVKTGVLQKQTGQTVSSPASASFWRTSPGWCRTSCPQSSSGTARSPRSSQPARHKTPHTAAR